jgi:PAS domain-containing protein
MTTVDVEDILTTWHEAERVLDALSPLSPHHETLRRSVVALRATYEAMTGGAAATAGALSSSRQTVQDARELLGQIRTKATAGRPARPTVSTVPHADLAFRAHVEWALEQSAVNDPADLERYLRDAYPDVRVHPRIALADLGGERAWYAYRDGSPSYADGDWWSTPGLATFEIDATGTYVKANAAAADLVGRAIEDIVGARVGSLTRHGSADDPGQRAFDVLSERGWLESTAVVVRPDGNEVPVRYRIAGTPREGYQMVMSPR